MTCRLVGELVDAGLLDVLANLLDWDLEEVVDKVLPLKHHLIMELVGADDAAMEAAAAAVPAAVPPPAAAAAAGGWVEAGPCCGWRLGLAVGGC
jgi:hypothetical protein